MQVVYLQFTLIFHIDWRVPIIDDVGAFVELLVRSNKTLGTIKNYISAIRSLYYQLGSVNILEWLALPVWGIMSRGLANTVRQTTDRRSAMSLDELERMVEFCSSDESLLVLKLALVIGFFGYLRLSNLAPETVVGFDKSRHTSWHDVRPSKHGVMIYLRWTKTLQSQKGCTPVPLPCLNNSLVCPVRVWNEYSQVFPGHVGSAVTPLLLSTGLPRGRVVSASQLRAMFYRVTTALDLGHRRLTPHSMRRGGATYSFAAGVPIQYIKAHGTWRSAAVERYLLQTPRFDTPVALSFKTLAR